MRWLAGLIMCTALTPVILHGAVEQGYYWTDVYLGSPQVKRELVVDTGSAATSLACDPCESCGSHSHPPFNPIFSTSFSYPSCSTLHCTTCQSDHCHFIQQFAEGSEIHGIYGQELFALEPGNTTFKLSFGCHNKEVGLLRGQLVDGVLGLAVGLQKRNDTVLDAIKEAGLVTTTRFSLCLGMEGGVLLFGEYSKTAKNGQSVSLRGETHYEVEFLSVTVGSSAPLLTPFPLATILDSGTTFVYFPDPLHDVFRSYFHQACHNHCGQTYTPPAEKHPCYRHTSGSLQEFYRKFPSVKLQLEDEWVVWQPEAYLYRYDTGLYCLGVHPSGGIQTVLGSLFLRLRESCFDRSRKRLTLYSSHCEVSNNV